MCGSLAHDTGYYFLYSKNDPNNGLIEIHVESCFLMAFLSWKQKNRTGMTEIAQADFLYDGFGLCLSCHLRKPARLSLRMNQEQDFLFIVSSLCLREGTRLVITQNKY